MLRYTLKEKHAKEPKKQRKNKAKGRGMKKPINNNKIRQTAKFGTKFNSMVCMIPTVLNKLGRAKRSSTKT